jgi:hypothetical protein
MRCIFVVFVDDFLITGHDADLIEWLVAQLNAKFGIQDLKESKKFVGIQWLFFFGYDHA